MSQRIARRDIDKTHGAEKVVSLLAWKGVRPSSGSWLWILRKHVHSMSSLSVKVAGSPSGFWIRNRERAPHFIIWKRTRGYLVLQAKKLYVVVL